MSQASRSTLRSVIALGSALVTLAGCGAKSAAPAQPAAAKPPSAASASPAAAEPPSAAAAPNTAAVSPVQHAKPLAVTKDGEPDATGEPGCVTWRWTSFAPSWQRETIDWNPTTRSLEREGTTQRFDEQGRVRDFGENADSMEYDAAGNPSFRGSKTVLQNAAYRYRNGYDAKHRLISVDVALRLGSKWGAYDPYRRYHYDAPGRIDTMEIQPHLREPMMPATLSYDAQGRIERIVWGGNDPAHARQVEQFRYDPHGRLADYERDGLMLKGGIAADGTPDWKQRFEYAPAGYIRRVEAVSPGAIAASDQKDLTIFSPGCLELAKLAPSVYVLPYVPLPVPLLPRWF